MATNILDGGNCVKDLAFGFVDKCTAIDDILAVEYVWIFWLSVATPATFTALAIARILYLSRHKCQFVARAPRIVLAVKLSAGIMFASIRLGLLVVSMWQKSSRRLVASLALNVIASVILLVLSPHEHLKRSRPSTLTCSFLILTLVYDLARCRLLWIDSRIDGNYRAFTGLTTAAIVMECAFLVVESVRRRRWVVWDAADGSPEETSSILSLGVYAWFNPLLWRGYHEPLAMPQLYPLDPGVSVKNFDSQNKNSTLKRDRLMGPTPWHILLWLSRPLGLAALLPIIPRACLLGFTFCQPFFLERLLYFLSSEELSSSSTQTASGLIAVAVFTYLGIAISTALYWYFQERFQTLLRAFLISTIYSKLADLRHVGEGDTAPVTLMGADVERIYTGLRYVHEVWINAIQIALSAWLLQQKLGLAFIAPLVVVLLGFAASFALSHRAVPYQAAWMASVQARTGITSSTIANAKDLRVSGMTSPATALVQRERENELRVGERSRVLIAISASLSQLPQAVAPALAFAFGPHVLDETRAYTSLSLLALLTSPLMVVLQSLPIIAASVACLKRIKAFLDQEERVDRRQLGHPSNVNKNEIRTVDKRGDLFVIVRDGCFGWTTAKHTLKNINLNLPKSSITFVVGPVASGKSTLCRAVLGEVPYAEGTVILGSDKLGYCDQAPFLFNVSIMENIIGFSSFDPVRYADVIHATMLGEDLRSLPSGDKTIVGSNGISLSGGQRQRVSLARALYYDAEVLVLDDVFSGLDGSTQHMVCQAVFGTDGLLRRRGTTAVICTHSTHVLYVADHIVTLGSNGNIADQGSFTDFAQDRERARRAGLLLSPDPIAESVNEYSAGISNTGIQPPQSAPRMTGSLSTKALPLPVPSQSVDIAVYRHWLSAIGLLPLLVYLVLIVGNGFCSNFPTIWLKFWSADSVSQMPDHSFAYWVGIYAAIGASVVLCVFPASLVMLRTAVRLAGTDLHHATVNTVMHSSLSFLGTTDVGKVLNLFSQDMSIMDTQLPRMVNNLCFCLSNAVGQAVVITLSSAWLTVSYPFFIAVLWVVQRIYLPSSKRLRILDLEAKTPLYTNFLETLTGLPTIRAFGWFPHQLARNNALLDDSQRPVYLLAMAQQWLMLTMNVLVSVLAVIFVALATRLRSNAGNVGAGLVTLITLGSTLTTIVVAYTGLETSLGAISRLKSFGEETEQEGGTGEDVRPDKAWPRHGRVDIIGVNASYNGTDRVLKGLSLVIEAGEKVAICGRTGSGKSSIIAMLLRLIEPLPLNSPSTADDTVPSVLIDGQPLDTIDRTVLRERVISASQNPVFLPDSTSVRLNLDPWAAATDVECITALHDVGLASVFEDGGGLAAPIKGAELSAGQKQLFGLARAVLRRRVKRRETGTDGGLLLLDEITASADAETEQRVQKVLEDEFKAYTVIAVTHRREMAAACDRVVVLDQGMVVDDGEPDGLLDELF